MNRLDQIQEEHKVWREKNFPESPDHHPLYGMVEEMGELFHAVLKQEQGIRGTHIEHEVAKIDAVGDIVIYMIDFCNRNGWSLLGIVEDTWNEVKKRDWQKNKKDGTNV